MSSKLEVKVEKEGMIKGEEKGAPEVTYITYCMRKR